MASWPPRGVSVFYHPIFGQPRCSFTKWNLWSLDVKNASSQAAGFDRDVSHQAPVEWEPPRNGRIWELPIPACGPNDAPVAFRRSVKRHILNSETSMERVGIRCQVSTFDSCLFFIFRDAGSAAGSLTTHIDDILGCGNLAIFPRFEIIRNDVPAK